MIAVEEGAWIESTDILHNFLFQRYPLRYLLSCNLIGWKHKQYLSVRNCHICCSLPLFAKQSINLICIEAILLSKRGLGAFRVGLRCLHWNKTVLIVPDPFSYHLLMRSRVVTDCWSRGYRIHTEPYKPNANPIWKGTRADMCVIQYRVNRALVAFVSINRTPMSIWFKHFKVMASDFGD